MFKNKEKPRNGNIPKVKNSVDTNSLEVFALVLDFYFKRIPFFERKVNKTRVFVNEENIVCFEVFISKYKTLRYFFVFSELGFIPGKDWIIQKGKNKLDSLVVLSRNVHKYERRLMFHIIYENIITWMHGEYTERRVISVLRKYVEEKYIGVLYNKKVDSFKDRVLKYDYEVGITEEQGRDKFLSDTVKIDIKSSKTAMRKTKSGSLMVKNGTVHLLLVEDEDSEDTIIRKFERILKAHKNGQRVLS